MRPLALRRRRRYLERHHPRARTAEGHAWQDRRRGLAAGTCLGADRGRGRRDVPLGRRRRDLGARVRSSPRLRTRPWYYMHVTADPVDPDTVYVQNYRLWKSIDAGSDLPAGPHAARRRPRALDRSPRHPKRMIEGNDGGACVSFNGGAVLVVDLQPADRAALSRHDRRALPLPRLRFAAGQHRDQHSERLADRRDHERDWIKPGGGESGYIAIKPDDPRLRRRLRPGRAALPTTTSCTSSTTRPGRTGRITVWPELYGWGVGADALKYRFNWTFPIHVLAATIPTCSVAASQHPASARRTWARAGKRSAPISRATTKRSSRPRADRSRAITPAPRSTARSSRSPNRRRSATCSGAAPTTGWCTARKTAGANGPTSRPRDLPEWALISIVEPSPHDRDAVYIAATRYKHDDTRPYLYKTTDRGKILDQDRARHPRRRVHAHHPRRPEPARAALLRHRDRHLRLLRRRRASGSGSAATCRSRRSTTW